MEEDLNLFTLFNTYINLLNGHTKVENRAIESIHKKLNISSIFLSGIGAIGSKENLTYQIEIGSHKELIDYENLINTAQQRIENYLIELSYSELNSYKDYAISEDSETYNLIKEIRDSEMFFCSSVYNPYKLKDVELFLDYDFEDLENIKSDRDKIRLLIGMGIIDFLDDKVKSVIGVSNPEQVTRILVSLDFFKSKKGGSSQVKTIAKQIRDLRSEKGEIKKNTEWVSEQLRKMKLME